MTTDQTFPAHQQLAEPDQELAHAETALVGRATRHTRRRVLTMALGGAGALALAASGTLALRQVAAKDDDDDRDDDHGGDDHGGDDHSGGGGGGDDDSGGRDSSGSGSGGGNGTDDDDDDSGRGRGRGRGRGGDDNDNDNDDDDRDDNDDDDRRDNAITAGTPVAGAIEIRITDDDADAFLPQSVTVEPGTRVTFVNNDDKDHTATGAGFDTGILAPGDSASVTLDEPGTWFYACIIHPEMTGTIIVQGTPGATPAATPRVIEGSAGPAGAGGDETVSIANFAFAPADLTVAVGTTVTWENTDSAPHTATADDGSFDTDRIDPGASASVTFDTPGTFAYVCLFHPNMQATITVE